VDGGHGNPYGDLTWFKACPAQISRNSLTLDKPLAGIFTWASFIVRPFNAIYILCGYTFSGLHLKSFKLFAAKYISFAICNMQT
jgi:hypothetical protein